MVKLKKKTLIEVLAILATAALLTGALIALVKMADNKTETPTGETVITSYRNIYEDEEEKNIIFFNGEQYEQKDNVETFLFIGIDKESDDEGSSQADFLLLFAVDHDSKSYSALQINRDTMTEIKEYGQYGDYLGTKTAQIALAHAYGDDEFESCEYTVEAAEGLLLGTEINHYVAITLDAIPVLNDTVGGVTVTIPSDLTKADPMFVEGATITLTGSQAETFVRARMSLDDSTNISRMERQRIFMSAWQKKASEKLSGNSDFMWDLVLSTSNYIYSDMDADGLSEFGSKIASYKNDGTVYIEGTTEEKDHVEFYPDEKDLQGKIVNMFYDRYEAS